MLIYIDRLLRICSEWFAVAASRFIPVHSTKYFKYALLSANIITAGPKCNCLWHIALRK
jgi:hypothetical protein